jgi:proteic killer suppression protein
MIRDVADAETARVREGRRSRKLPPDIRAPALRKLMMLHRWRSLNDLRLPPANRLEALKGKRAGQWIIRINRRWRICFVWRDGDVSDVEIVDYHDE